MDNFQELVKIIKVTHNGLQSKAINAVNQALTIRNYLIGFYIIEFEQNGKDRANYGGRLLNKLAIELETKGLTSPELSRCRQFYQRYPQIFGTLSQELNQFISGELLERFSKKSLSSNRIESNLLVPPEKLLAKLSFSHFAELIKIEEPLKRTFYELECIRGTWSVRELKRQINSLYYERSGLSTKPEKLAEMVHEKNSLPQPSDIIKNIYAFEFLDLNSREIVEETDLETALLDHLQNFIIELGNGFCLEARQKRILIGDSYYYIDLLFYHRILKCHILIELKIGQFEHGHIGQLNTYLNYFKAEISEETDNPPIGILLVAEKDHALVKYATAGMDDNLFVQQYLIKLPSVRQLREYIEGELKSLI